MVFSALLQGMKVILGDHQYQMDDTYRVCQIARDQYHKVYLLPVGHSDIADLIRLVQSANDDQLTVIWLNLGMSLL
jgi:hypothetical protein